MHRQTPRLCVRLTSGTQNLKHALPVDSLEQHASDHQSRSLVKIFCMNQENGSISPDDDRLNKEKQNTSLLV